MASLRWLVLLLMLLAPLLLSNGASAKVVVDKEEEEDGDPVTRSMNFLAAGARPRFRRSSGIESCRHQFKARDIAPFTVTYAGKRGGGGAPVQYDFKVEAWPDTALDASGTPVNVACMLKLIKLYSPATASNCCSRAKAGAPRSLQLTLATACDGVNVTVDGLPVQSTVKGSDVQVPALPWPAGNGAQASVMVTLTVPAGSKCDAAAYEDNGPCPAAPNGCAYVVRTSTLASATKDACCDVTVGSSSGGTWDAFSAYELAKKDAEPSLRGAAERHLIVGDVGAGFDGNYYSKTASFSPKAVAENAPYTVSQHIIGRQMAKVAAVMPPTYVLNTGDNFYEMGSNKSVPFRQTYELVYFQYDSLKSVPWLSVLGNHDIGYYVGYMKEPWIGTAFQKCTPNLTPGATVAECLAAECCYSPIFQQTARINHPLWRLESNTFTVSTSLLDFAFWETNALAYSHKKSRSYWTNVPGGLSTEDVAAATQAVYDSVKQSAAFRWKVVVGHHSLKNYGSHCLLKKEPWLTRNQECVNLDPVRANLTAMKLPLYINGHDHTQQVVQLEEGKTLVVTSGAGAKNAGVYGAPDGSQPSDLLFPKFGVNTCKSKDYYKGKKYKIDLGFAMLGADADRLVVKLFSSGLEEGCRKYAKWTLANVGLTYAKVLPKADYAACTTSQGTKNDKYSIDMGFGVLGADPDRLVVKLFNAGLSSKCRKSAKWMRANAGLAYAKILPKADYA